MRGPCEPGPKKKFIVIDEQWASERQVKKKKKKGPGVNRRRPTSNQRFGDLNFHVHMLGDHGQGWPCSVFWRFAAHVTTNIGLHIMEMGLPSYLIIKLVHVPPKQMCSLSIM
jgi:hypothetical protein